MENYLFILKALTDETRLRIINLLYVRELCVCEIEEIIGSSQTKISRHLAYLKNSGLANVRRSAQWSYYSIEKTTDLKFIDELVKGILRTIDIYKNDLKLLKKIAKPDVCRNKTIIKRKK